MRDGAMGGEMAELAEAVAMQHLLAVLHLDDLVEVYRHVHAWIQEGQDIAPGLMMGLAALIVLPLLAVASLALRLISRRRRPVDRTTGAAQPIVASRISTAWLAIDGQPPVVLSAGRDLVRIGREDDNDLCLADDRVHRYHAVVHRTSDAGLGITDVSGPGGHGILINGRRVGEARLLAGDCIELGGTRLTLRTRESPTSAEAGGGPSR